MDDVVVPADGGPTPARHRRAWVLAASTVLVVLLSGASAHADGTTSSPANLTTTAVRPAYHGEYVTPDDVATLQAQGLATAEVINRELVCQGVELYFDTTAERDAYVADYDSRFPVEPPYLAGDPCSPYRDSPHYVAGQ